MPAIANFAAVPAAYRQRVLLFGVILALVLRGAFIAVGAAALFAPDAFFASTGIQLGALICLVDDRQLEQWLLLGPVGAGLKLEREGLEIMLITAQAPLGQQLLGRGPGDEVQAGPSPRRILRVL